MAALRCAVAQLLQALARGRHAGAQSLLDLAFGRRMALRLDGRPYLLEFEFALDGAHQRLVAAVIMAVRGDAAVEANPVDQQVDVGMRGVRVTRHQVLVVVEAHAVQVALGHLFPLVFIELLAGRSGQ